MVRLTRDMVENLAPGSLSLIELFIFARAQELYYSDAEWLELSPDAQDSVKQIKYVGYLRC